MGTQMQPTTAPAVHQQMVALALSSPYGDNPIFKNLKPNELSEDALKPTNPAAQKAILESGSNQFKISPKIRTGLNVKPVGSLLTKVSTARLSKINCLAKKC